MIKRALIVGVYPVQTPIVWYWGAIVPPTTSEKPDNIEGGVNYAGIDIGCPKEMRDNSHYIAGNKKTSPD